ncbi:MAG: TonB C-terminal domain-containing protein [Elusimicrobiales bacterium]|nr:TonB C-terminal domain-containing protein [Elusimicrobiales bacterium]
MRHYLIFSSSAHFVLLAVLFFVSRNSLGLVKHDAYYIDFIGPSKVVTMEKAALPEGKPDAAAAKPAKAAARAEKPDEDDFSSGALPKPSVLAGGGKLFEEERRKEGGEEGTPIVTDSANFPYPWYITQVRELLWNTWTARMPSGGDLRCTVRFSILRDGAVRAVSVEKSSGNRLFDNAAESSVESSAPFPALPDDFYEDKLTVHVEFKAME